VARRVILDTGVIIAFERGQLDIDAVLGADDAAIASITAMELLVGVERASDAHQQRRAVHVEAVLSSVPIVDYTLDVARVHARLAVQALTLGRPRSAYDMIVAATAVAEGRVLLTTDASADFTGLVDVSAELLHTTDGPATHTVRSGQA
jgi:tRNA(fMet)-specific endonuclease VapC